MLWLLTLGLRILTPHAIDVRIACLTNTLDSPLSWQEREAVFAKLSDLFWYQYVQQNVKNAEVRLFPETYDCPIDWDDGVWFLAEDF